MNSLPAAFFLFRTIRRFCMLISCHHIKKAFGTDQIIKDAVLTVDTHEKMAVVGVNGAGKTTLLRMIIGELQPDEGQVVIARDASVGYLAQQNMTEGELTIYEEVAKVRRDIFQAEEKIRDLELAMKHASGSELSSLMEQYHRLITWFEQNNGYAVRSEITGILKGLGFSEEDFSRKSDTLSGGQKTRVALGRLLLSSPDVILLDEPTNHLDMHSIAWLENYLVNYKGAVVIVSHDRYFMDKIVSKIVEIDHGDVMTFRGNYSQYAEQKKQLRKAQRSAWLNQQQQIRHQEEVIARLKSFNREKSIRRAESREKMLDRMERLERPADGNDQIRFCLDPDIESGNDVLHVAHLSKSFDDLVLFKDLNFDVQKRERVAVIGDNGTGKTTLLKIINGMTEADAGEIRLGTNVLTGYYDQEHQVLHDEKTLFDELHDEYPDLNNTRIRNVLAAFLFTGDDVYKLVHDLSGGERGRLSLAKLMLSGANTLLLDEPTNHLDIESREILEEALKNYTGTVIYVSHDRYFINQTCTRILDLTGQKLLDYIGNYDYYLEKQEQMETVYLNSTKNGKPVSSDTGQEKSPETENAPRSFAAAGSREDWNRKKEEQARERKRRNDLEKTEASIAAYEERDREIDHLLSQPDVFSDIERCMDLTSEKAQISRELETLYERWEELAQ